MARQFSSREARQLARRHTDLLTRMRKADGILADYRTDVKKACDRLLMTEALKLLESIPIEEINRDRKGIKTKLLRDEGYENVADVYAETPIRLAAIRGISDEGASVIKDAARDIFARTCKEVKLRLSADDRSPDATALVKSLYLYRRCLPHAQVCDELLAAHEGDVNAAFGDLQTSINEFKWLFTGRATKNRAIVAFETLRALAEGDYGTRADIALAGLDGLSSVTEEDTWEAFTQGPVAFFTTLEELCPGCLEGDDAVYGLPEDLAREIRDQAFFPEGLLCSLRRYQEWGVKYILHQGRVLLGDEMGLGKTVQAIAAMVSLKNTGATHFAVICPASVMTNWSREIRKHSRLSVIEVHGFGREQELKDWVEHGGVAVTTYETTMHFRLPQEFRFAMAVVDEAHYIKNPDARRTINTKKLCEHTDRLLFMTGTALENNVEEMIGLIRTLRPDVAKQVEGIAYMAAAPQFRDKVAPVYYRRKREDVLNELPDLIESREWCVMTPEEEAVYEDAVLSRRFADARRVSWNTPDLKDSSKAQRLMEIVDEAKRSQRRVIVFSFFLDTVRRVCELLGERCMPPITGALTPARRQEIIDDFSKSPSGTVLPAQIQSGGTGLNIQAASVVIICEPQFKPSIENQAISRAYRMGQARNVLVYRLLCEDTVDERITDILEQKQAIFDAFADESVAGKESLSLDDSGFGGIIEDEIRRINQKRGATPASKPAATPSSAPKSPAPKLATSAAPAPKTVSPSAAPAVGSSPAVKVPSTIPAPPADPYGPADPAEYTMELSLSYADLVEYLTRKYGEVGGDYFVDESCTTVNLAIRRTFEGLICHHVDEDKAAQLSDPRFAQQHPFAYQTAERLVYATMMEHLILHVKIAEERAGQGDPLSLTMGIVNAVRSLCREINDYYDHPESVQSRQSRVLRKMEGMFDTYLAILRYFIAVAASDPTYTRLVPKRDLTKGVKDNTVKCVWEQLF